MILKKVILKHLALTLSVTTPVMAKSSIKILSDATERQGGRSAATLEQSSPDSVRVSGQLSALPNAAGDGRVGFIILKETFSVPEDSRLMQLKNGKICVNFASKSAFRPTFYLYTDINSEESYTWTPANPVVDQTGTSIQVDRQITDFVRSRRGRPIGGTILDPILIKGVGIGLQRSVQDRVGFSNVPLEIRFEVTPCTQGNRTIKP